MNRGRVRQIANLTGQVLAYSGGYPFCISGAYPFSPQAVTELVKN
ncbi:hypothetical protein [uncultured Phocaeicola sp.]|nr:hypothetical protein [uncultured Phocaeicola sp.]